MYKGETTNVIYKLISSFLTIEIIPVLQNLLKTSQKSCEQKIVRHVKLCWKTEMSVTSKQ
jgi:hypothetical protein